MLRLEDITRGAVLKGVVAGEAVTVVDVKWFGATAVELTYKLANGSPRSDLLFRDREASLELATEGHPWSFSADGELFRLASEAYRIRLAHLFDPYMAVHTSLVEPLPHQIMAVYGEMLPRQPLRFLLADDPGAGKTIMAGLLIRELIVRGDLERCLIICPGNLAEQWQDELYEKFNLLFDVLTRDKVESSPSGNPFNEMRLVVARLDHLSRNEVLQEKLKESNWDLVVCDEAHKMSATYFGNEARYTKRYRLGQLVSGLTRHFLLMTATPHNGKEADFQLFMSLLDGDRFEGRYREGVHQVDVGDLMRRTVKERMVRFDGTPLFPERRAYTVSYRLSDAEAALYSHVTDYVREEFNRADALENEGRRGTIGFALTILQRRLASSPEAIHQSLVRRRKRLEKRLQEEELLRRGALVRPQSQDDIPDLTLEDLEDLDDAPDAEIEEAEDRIVDLATASQTIAELKAEIAILQSIENEAEVVLRSGTDKKWEELSSLLQDVPEMFDEGGSRRKLVVFTEHRDTLNYLIRRISILTGAPDTIVTIHGGLARDKRREAASRFTQDPEVHILVATDAAGEGINLQRAHLMVNYDLPWNPNRLEQRFGRIHRIGQTEVCHLWNMVAGETREGQVLERLCEKIQQESEALRGQVFDVLGKAFAARSLRELLLEAIRYGDQPEVRDRLNRVIDEALDHEHLRELIEDRSLAQNVMDDRHLRRVREDMERNAAKRLQPHFIQAFFLEGFQQLGGTVRERETKRFEIRHVPAVVRARDRQIGTRDVVLTRYERITFEKELIRVPGLPLAEFVCPGHPLLNAVLDLLLERHRHLIRQGAILVDPNDPTEEPRTLFYLEHCIRDARTDRQGNWRTISRRLQFTEISPDGTARNAGQAPYLDYRPCAAEEQGLLADTLAGLRGGGDPEQQALLFVVEHLVPGHLREVRERTEERVLKTMAAVKDRLTVEINYWDHRTEQLKLQEQAGKVNARLNSDRARQRADELEARLHRRLEELERERQIAPLSPVVAGGALVIPAGLLARLRGERFHEPALFARETKRVELLGMQAVMDVELSLGNEPRDVSRENLGWDIESRDPETGRLRFIEAKGRIAVATTVTVTRNEILASFNEPEAFILAIVLVPTSPEMGGKDVWDVQDADTRAVTPADCEVHYVTRPFDREPGFAENSVNYDLAKLLAMGSRMGTAT
jgi:superfamily II DNA or RNA helicase